MLRSKWTGLIAGVFGMIGLSLGVWRVSNAQHTFIPEADPVTARVELNGGEDMAFVARCVIVEAPTWIVIRADSDGLPGAVLGYSLANEGENDYIAVAVNSANATETLHILFHLDEGTPGLYEFPGVDAPLVNADGSMATLTVNRMDLVQGPDIQIRASTGLVFSSRCDTSLANGSSGTDGSSTENATGIGGVSGIGGTSSGNSTGGSQANGNGNGNSGSNAGSGDDSTNVGNVLDSDLLTGAPVPGANTGNPNLETNSDEDSGDYSADGNAGDFNVDTDSNADNGNSSVDGDARFINVDTDSDADNGNYNADGNAGDLNFEADSTEYSLPDTEIDADR